MAWPNNQVLTAVFAWLCVLPQGDLRQQVRAGGCGQDGEGHTKWSGGGGGQAADVRTLPAQAHPGILWGKQVCVHLWRDPLVMHDSRHLVGVQLDPCEPCTRLGSPGQHYITLAAAVAAELCFSCSAVAAAPAAAAAAAAAALPEAPAIPLWVSSPATFAAAPVRYPEL